MDFSSEQLLINFTWDISSSQNPYPKLMILEKDKLIEKRIEYGSLIEGKVLPSRLCIGYESDQGQWVPCPKKNKPAQGYLQCFSCAKHDFFSCRATCRGEVCHPSSAKAQKLCSTKDTSVYLTVVGNKLKVGVSMNPLKRWLDQGSFYGVEIFRTYGLTARKIENEISKFLGITKSMQFTTKVKALASTVNEQEGVKLLQNALHALESFDWVTEDKIPKPRIISLTRHYGEFPRIHLIPEQLKQGQPFSGELAGAMGKLILLKNNGIYYVLNMKQAFGHYVKFIETTHVKKMPGQKTLFEFF